MLSAETTLLIQMSGLSYHNLIEIVSSPFPPSFQIVTVTLTADWLRYIYFPNELNEYPWCLFLRIRGIFLALIYGTVKQEKISGCVNHFLPTSGVCLQSRRGKSAAAAFNACKLQEHGESRQAWQIFSSISVSQRQAQTVPDSDSSHPAWFGFEMAF